MLGYALGVSCIVLIVGAWFLLTLGEEAESRIISPTILQSPWEVVASLPSLIIERKLLESIGATLWRVILGFSLAVLIGVPLGMAAGTWRSARAFLAPVVLYGRNMPLAALIPLTVLWFGIGEFQKVMFIFIACVPFITADAASAVMGIHDRYVETAQTLGASSRQIAFKVLAPLALPDIFVGLRHLFGLAFGYIMLVELFDAKAGLGYLISVSQRLGPRAHIYLILIIIGILAYGIDRLLAFFQRGLFPYRSEE
ncbi:MAG: hypothetical protein A2289_01880 [Deltaproteobacteria bacterium RIFOXYA12_FULL_58_15]|nr:MAG: hypothetical protein A2289_01880 [Deltaproteobacteria bacterium RIFOXYA12_FULL_58_15]OGR08763.1 MAG: hypothetical protein A2341_13785 [Deltaproteobacteria bacterium RIFOXYB12_FULL_58_9]